MKLLVTTEKFGGEPMVRIEWGKEGLFFTGAGPPVPALIVLDLPGCKSQKADAIRDWIVAHHRGGAEVRRENTTLTPELWRVAVLDDFLDAINATSLVWHIANYFSLADITTFAAAHGPALHGEIREALDTARAKRPAALRKVHKRSERIVPVIGAADRRILIEANAREVELDREDFAALTATPFDSMAWIDAAAKLRSDEVKNDLLATIARQLVATGGDISAALDRMLVKKLDTLYGGELWKTLTPYVTLAPNVSGETIDLTKAREITVGATWDVWKSRRIGPVKIGRTALYLHDGKRGTYVRGERKLKYRIKARGGSVTRWGNTLTIAAKDPASVHTALLRVDEIDSLSQLAPARAAALVGEPLPADHPIANALAHAIGEPRWRRILADLLIERLVGIDADVARRLARAEARSNRR